MGLGAASICSFIFSTIIGIYIYTPAAGCPSSDDTRIFVKLMDMHRELIDCERGRLHSAGNIKSQEITSYEIRIINDSA